MLFDMYRATCVFLLCLSWVQPLLGREFKSADGKSTLEAEFVRYSHETGKVTLRLNPTKNIVSPATAFSAEDQAYFKETQKQVDMKESLEVKIKRDLESVKEDLGEGDVVTNRKVEYSFVVTNKSLSTMSGMKLEYWVLVQQDVDREAVNTITNKVELEPLWPGAVVIIKAPSFPMYKFERRVTNDRERGKVTTIDKKRYEIHGARVDLISSTGETLLSDRTSIRVDKVMEAKP